MCGVRPKFWEGGWIEMEKKQANVSWQLPGVCPDLFLLLLELGRVYLGAVYVSDGHRQIESGDVLHYVGFELVRRGADPDRGVYQ